MTEPEAREGVSAEPLPRPAPYGHRTLADLMPSVLAALGLEGFANPMGIEPLRAACVFIVDGLGQEDVLEHADAAPFLAEAARANDPLSAGFPATTVASLGSLATGVPPGEHGLVGYTVPIDGHDDRPMNLLLWELYGHGPDPAVPLVDVFPPEGFQPVPTLFERAAAIGPEVAIVGPPEHAGSALTRAILRGGHYVGAGTLGELVLSVETILADGHAGYAYHPGLDFHGHMTGPGSGGWLRELAEVDAAIHAIADRLPPGAALFVTGDHGMVTLTPDQKIDVADEPVLMAGVRFLAGEARARHVLAVDGAERDVLAIWQDEFGDRMWVVSRDEAIDAGWFGPVVVDRARRRIGDVVAAARGRIGVFQREVDPLQAMLVGHHGSLTDAERLVPCAVWRA
jgi:hypothetical protein